jgi:hypothetical protein
MAVRAISLVLGPLPCYTVLLKKSMRGQGYLGLSTSISKGSDLIKLTCIAAKPERNSTTLTIRALSHRKSKQVVLDSS